jgi:endonuclease G
MEVKKLILGIILGSITGLAIAGSCDFLYPKHKEIIVPDTIELCNSFFVSRYSNKNQAVYLTSEVVIPSNIHVLRSNDFRADKRVPFPVSPKQYTGTGFDKGHMVPAADATTDVQMSETFLMTNMTPQQPTLNRKAWKDLEEYIRGVSDSNLEELRVITGAIYPLGYKSMNGVPIPQSYYKIVYRKDGSIQAFYADNVKNAKVKPVTVQDLEVYSGLKLH